MELSKGGQEYCLWRRRSCPFIEGKTVGDGVGIGFGGLHRPVLVDGLGMTSSAGALVFGLLTKRTEMPCRIRSALRVVAAGN